LAITMAASRCAGLLIMSGERDLERTLADLRPVRRPGEFVFVSVDDPSGLAVAAMITEDEGWSYVVPRADADENALHFDFVAAWITLRVHSSLGAVGLTAAFSAALADEGISANVLAGLRHDHILVPTERADDALEVLRGLSRR
jgi:hypothetical protein